MQDVETVAITKNEETYSPALAGAQASAEAWLKAACGMAARFPRDLDIVRQKLLKECDRPSFAAVALYAKPIGNTKVTGLSIRFAEAAIQSMGHIHVTVQTLAETDDWRKVEVRVWDAQNMTSIADEATVQKTIERHSVPKGTEVIRTRHNTKGELLYIIRAEEGDLLNTVNAAKSKAMRNCGLRLVPGWLLDECKDAINETMRSKDAADPDAAKKKLFDSFGELGVSVDALKKYLGHDNPTLQPAELQELRKLYTAIKDGETTIQKALDVKAEENPVSETKGQAGLKERLAGNSDRLLNDVEISQINSSLAKNNWVPMAFISGIKKKWHADAPSLLKLSQLPEVLKWIESGD